MIPFLELASAVNLVYTSGIEFIPESFVALSGQKLEAFLRKMGPMTETMYEVVAMEPSVINRVGNEKVTLELNVVTERQRKQLLDAIKFIYHSSQEMRGKPSFQEWLEWLRLRLPTEITGGDLPRF